MNREILRSLSFLDQASDVRTIIIRSHLMATKNYIYRNEKSNQSSFSKFSTIYNETENTMKKLFWSAVGILAFGKLVDNTALLGFGGILGLSWLAWIILIGTKMAAVSGTQLAVEKYKEKQEEKKEEKEYQKQLRREIERERLKSEMQLNIYRKQIELMVEYKKKGADITKELFDMRKNLLELESAENKNMIAEIMQTLDAI